MFIYEITVRLNSNISYLMMMFKVAASAGFNVVLVDRNKDILDKSVAGIQNSLKRVVKKKYEKDPQVINNYLKPTPKGFFL